jgi:hypothetical protein
LKLILRFKVQSSKFKVQGSRFKVQGSRLIETNPIPMLTREYKLPQAAI